MANPIKKIFTALFRPETHLGRWLVAILLLAIFIPGASGHLEPVKQFLDSESLTFKVGHISLSLYRILKGLVALIGLFWIAGIVTATGEKYLKQLKMVKASNRALMVKGFQSLVYLVMFFTGLDVLGIDLTAFAVLGGAIGIGIGFGLQKITSNFITGLILLFEKSVQEGDLIEMSDNASGYVRYTGARYTLIETFDGKEIMIPNEDFITNRVTNWTYSNKRGRIEINIGVAYETPDLELVRSLMLEAATEHKRTSKINEPNCFLVGFGDSSINFTMYFWVDDVTDGRLEPQSDVLFAIWQKFKTHNITIPYPQRDIFIKNPAAAVS